jgi:hypothetical protein
MNIVQGKQRDATMPQRHLSIVINDDNTLNDIWSNKSRISLFFIIVLSILCIHNPSLLLDPDCMSSNQESNHSSAC